MTGTPRFVARTLLAAIPAALLVAAATPEATDALVRGTVTDAAGKPIAGALVKANIVNKSVSRYTGADGRYELTLPPGTYDIVGEAFGFRVERQMKKEIAGDTAINFSLTPAWGVTQFTGADVDQFIADDHAGRMLKSTCINCHALDVMLRHRGWAAGQWRNYVEKQMQLRIGRGPYNASDNEWKELTTELERYFGPEGKYFGTRAEPPKREEVRRPKMAPEVARATFYEYTLPNARSMPHSLAVDPVGRVWISGWDSPTNAVVRFDTATEQFKTYPIPTANAVPHTPCVTKDGRVWMALNAAGTAKAAVIDPKTDRLAEISWGAKRPGTHNCQEDREGNLWFASLGEADEGFYVYNPKTQRFRSYKYPLPTAYPEGSKALRDTAEGDQPPPVRAGLYDAKVDSTGTGWGVAYSMGMIVRVNPRTGEVKEYFPPNTPHIRGVFVDSRDTVWFAAFGSHKIGKLDPKTGEIKMYQPPTERAAPYSFVEDARRGVLWFGDLNGNNLTRFDPRTETFIEYPLPSRNVNARLGIGIDPRGRIWFTEFLNGRIGALDPGDGARNTNNSR